MRHVYKAAAVVACGRPPGRMFGGHRVPQRLRGRARGRLGRGRRALPRGACRPTRTRPEFKIALERAMLEASRVHFAAAQATPKPPAISTWPCASTARRASSTRRTGRRRRRSRELDQTIRDRIEASRPKPPAAADARARPRAESRADAQPRLERAARHPVHERQRPRHPELHRQRERHQRHLRRRLPGSGRRTAFSSTASRSKQALQQILSANSSSTRC